MKISYDKLTDNDKNIIVEKFYNNKNLSFKEISDLIGYSERSISRVLKENLIKELRVNSKKESVRIYKIFYENAGIYLERKQTKWLNFLSAYVK